MHYNTIYLAIFTAVAVSASSILPRRDGDDPFPGEVIPGNDQGIPGPPIVCVGVGQHCDGPFNCCELDSAGMFISVPSIHYYIDLSLPVTTCGFGNVCVIIPPPQSA